MLCLSVHDDVGHQSVLQLHNIVHVSTASESTSESASGAPIPSLVQAKGKILSYITANVVSKMFTVLFTFFSSGVEQNDAHSAPYLGRLISCPKMNHRAWFFAKCTFLNM